MGDLRVLQLLETVLGSAKRTSGENYSFYCPFCNHRKRKLEIHISTYRWNCWTCNSKGRNLFTLFKKIGASQSQINALSEIVGNNKKISFNPKETKSSINLPPEFTPLWKGSNSLDYKHAMHYLKKRGLTCDDIIKYRIGYCANGPYKSMIIVPSYDSEGQLNYFVARKFYDIEGGMKYKNPPISKNVICFDHLINWSMPITLVEGMFDAMAVRRNTIPLLGKVMSKKLREKLAVSSSNKVYIALDDDALKESLQIAEFLIKQGKNTYLIELPGKDPSEIGFEKFIGLLDNATELSFSEMMKYRLQT